MHNHLCHPLEYCCRINNSIINPAQERVTFLTLLKFIIFERLMDEIEEGEIEQAGGDEVDKGPDRSKTNKLKPNRNEASPSSSLDSDKQEAMKKDKDKSKSKKAKKVKKTPRSNQIVSSSYRTKKCEFYMKGACVKGDNCEFSHDFPVERSKKLCRFFMSGHCSKGSACFFNHDTTTYPCRFYHLEKHCKAGDECRFSHGPVPEGELEDFLKDNLDLLTNMYKSMRLENEPMLKQYVQSKLNAFGDTNKQAPTMPSFGKQSHPTPGPPNYNTYAMMPDLAQYRPPMPNPNPMWNRQYAQMPPPLHGQPPYGYRPTPQAQAYPYPSPFPLGYHGGYLAPSMYTQQVPPLDPSRTANTSNRSFYPIAYQREFAPSAFNPSGTVPAGPYPSPYGAYGTGDWSNPNYIQQKQISPPTPANNQMPRENTSSAKAQNPPKEHVRQSSQQNTNRTSSNKNLEKSQSNRNSKKTVSPIIEREPIVSSFIDKPKQPSAKTQQQPPLAKQKAIVDDPFLRSLKTFLDYRY